MKILVTGAKGFVGKTFASNFIIFRIRKHVGTSCQSQSKPSMSMTSIVPQNNLNCGAETVILYSISQE